MRTLSSRTPRTLLVAALCALPLVCGWTQVSVPSVPGFTFQVAEKFGGIGAVINKEPATGQMIVAGILPSGAAAKAGLLENDIITEVNGIPTQGMELKNVIDIIRGPAGTTVEITVSRGQSSSLQRLLLVREIVQIPSDPL